MEESKNLDKPNLKYRPEFAVQVYEHIKSGFTLSSFNVTPPVRQKTIFAWIHDHEEFALAVDKGRAEMLKKLEVALNIKTFGLKLTEQQKEAGIGKIDSELLKFRLARQYRNEYAEKQIVEHQGEVITKINFIEMPGREPRKKVSEDGRPEALPVSSNGTISD